MCKCPIAMHTLYWSDGLRCRARPLSSRGPTTAGVLLAGVLGTLIMSRASSADSLVSLWLLWTDSALTTACQMHTRFHTKAYRAKQTLVPAPAVRQYSKQTPHIHGRFSSSSMDISTLLALCLQHSVEHLVFKLLSWRKWASETSCTHVWIIFHGRSPVGFSLLSVCFAVSSLRPHYCLTVAHKMSLQRIYS